MTYDWSRGNLHCLRVEIEANVGSGAAAPALAGVARGEGWQAGRAEAQGVNRSKDGGTFSDCASREGGI